MGALEGLAARIAALPRWAVLLIVALIVRAVTFGNPVVHVDEEFYFVTANAMTQGALPYVDVWDRKPIGLFILYMPAAAFGLPVGIWIYQAMALACVVATAWLVAYLADRAGWHKGALAAAIAYILWLNFIEGQGGQAPVFYNLLIIGAAALIAPRPDDAAHPWRRFLTGFIALGFVGLALQLKYSVVFEGLFLGLWWMWREHKLGRPIWQMLPMAAFLAAAALAPTALAWGAYHVSGYGDAWVYANISSIAARKPDPMLEQFGNLLVIVLIVSPLLSLAAIAWRQRQGGADPDGLQRWLVAWAGAALAGLLVFGSWFDHYALPVIAPLAACAAGFLAGHRHRKLAMTLLLSWGLIGGTGVLILKRHNRGDAAQLAALTDAVGKGPGTLYVYSGTTMLYPATGRQRMTPWLFPSHLGRVRERGAIGTDQQAEIERILARRPDVVVVRKPYRGERAELRALVLARMKASYSQVAVLPMGNDRLSVYRLRR